MSYFRALPHSLGYIFSMYFLSLMILKMHHVHDCNRVLEVRRGLVVSTVLFSPTSLKGRVIKALELCSCGEKNYQSKPKEINTCVHGACASWRLTLMCRIWNGAKCLFIVNSQTSVRCLSRQNIWQTSIKYHYQTFYETYFYNI